MSETLEDLKQALANLSSSISSKMNERQGYLNQASDVQSVYDEMYRIKQIIKGYKKDIDALYDETYSNFKGTNFTYSYKPTVKDLWNAYDDTLNKIDTNLDALNNKKLYYNNKASECLGILGGIESTYNSVATRIANWTN